MINFQSLFLFDISAAVIMLVLANLSKRLGYALKIRHYYKILYATAFIVISASGFDLTYGAFSPAIGLTVSMGLRLAASIVALAVCLRYWNWLITEFIKK